AQHAAGNLGNRHVEIVCAPSARVDVSVLYQFVDTGHRPWPTWRRSAAGFFRSGSAWLGRSQKDGLPSCGGGPGFFFWRFKAINSRTGEGQPGRCPFQIGEMNAKTRDLALLTALSLFCAGVAWILDHLVLGSVFFALGVAAALGIAQKYWR